MKAMPCPYTQSNYRVLETEKGNLRHLCIARFYPDLAPPALAPPALPSSGGMHTFEDIDPVRIERIYPGIWVPHDPTPGSEYRRALDDHECILANYVLKDELNEQDVMTAIHILLEGSM